MEDAKSKSVVKAFNYGFGDNTKIPEISSQLHALIQECKDAGYTAEQCADYVKKNNGLQPGLTVHYFNLKTSKNEVSDPK